MEAPMVHIKIAGRLTGTKKYRRRNLPYKEAFNEGFLKMDDPEELYIAKLEPFPSIYNLHQYGVFIKGDGTLQNNHLLIKEFATHHEASEFKNFLMDSLLLEKIKIKLFSHKEDRIYYSNDNFISSDYYYQVYPQLKKYQHRKVKGQELDWFQFLKNLGMRETSFSGLLTYTIDIFFAKINCIMLKILVILNP